MNFPGSNTIKLTNEALMAAIEDALNASRLPGEDRIFVTDIERTYGYGRDVEITITTDKPTPADVATPTLVSNDKEAA